jgi:hypothetical protein
MDSGRKPPLRRLTVREEGEYFRNLLQAIARGDFVREGAPEVIDPPGTSYIGFRSPLSLKFKLEAAAHAAGHSLSAEVINRLELSFRSQTAFAEALALIFDTAEGEVPVERIATWLKQQLDIGLKS